jgi:YidC/Oxa1 family membrane protein insertase
MMFMPVLFSAMMINLPSGLTMYIFVSTLLGIFQQVMMKDKNTASSPA